MARFCKSDIEFHRDGYDPVHAAVNVKLYRWEWPDPARVAEDHGASAEEAAAFAAHWREIEDSETASGWGDIGIESGQFFLGEFAREIFGEGAEVFFEGRSGGWAVVAPDGRSPFTREDVSGWNALAVARWGRFVKACREACADVPYLALSGYYSNVWEPEREAEREAAARFAARLESIRRFSFYYDTPGVAA